MFNINPNNKARSTVLLILFSLSSLIALLILRNNSNYDRLNSKGSFIMSMICTDGIVVASDSRSVFYNNKNEIIAYYETSQKIYQYGNIALAMAGQFGFDTTRFNILFDSFKQKTKEKISIKKLLVELLDYSKKFLSKEKLNKLKSNQFLISGYENKKPIILWYDKDSEKPIIYSSGYKTNFIKDDDFKEIKNFIKNNNSESSSDIAIKMIKAIIESRNQNSISTVGGEVSVLIIFPKSLRWIKKPFKDEPTNASDFFHSLINGKTKLFYKSKNDSIMFAKNLNAVLTNSFK